MIIATALALALQSSPDPHKLMQAFWDKMHAAQKLYVETDYSSAQQFHKTFTWLEKPSRARWKSPSAETRGDGDTEIKMDRHRKQYVERRRGEAWCSPLLEPFFNKHRFDQPEMGPFDDLRETIHGATPRQVLILMSMDRDWKGSKIYVDPITNLPLELQEEGAVERIVKLEIDPKSDFTWPLMDGYTHVDRFGKRGVSIPPPR